jgi:uncharacterized protein
MKRDFVFLDANVLFSVAYGSVGLRQLWELSAKGACTLIASRYVIEEARRNLAGSDQPRMLDEYLAEIEVVHEADPDLSCPIDLPEKDVPVLMAAICAGADYLLTGDIKHFGTYFGKTVMGVQILMPRDYLLPRIHPR